MFESKEHAKSIAYAIAQLQKKMSASKAKRDLVWTHPDFPRQNSFINDTSTLIAAQCPRRSGKSEGLGRKQMAECFNYPGSNQLYIGLSLGAARSIMWEPVVKRLNEEKNLGGHPNESRLEIKFEHKPGLVSQYTLFGADASSRDIDKKLGGKYRSIVIDEAAFFKQDLMDMVYEKLLPCVADWDGWIALASTTSEYTRGLFYDITTGKEKGWSLHKWTGADNPFMKEKLERQIAMLKKNKPRIEETPAFRRMYLNEWVIDTDSFVYKYDRDVNDIDSLPHEDDLVNVLGIDLGFNDDTAFSLLSYSDYDPCCYIRHVYKRPAMIISEVAERIQWYVDKYQPTACVVDNASKQAVEELKQKFALPLVAAEKTGKAEFIEIMNSDFILGNIKLLPDALPLKKEYGSLIWDKDKLPKKIEHPGCANHLCFVAGTKVRTPRGLIDIAKLKVGEFVETRKGPKRIQYTIAREADVVQVNLSNGCRIVCTPDHPFYSDNKWIPAKNLNQTSKLLSWTQHLKQKELGGMGIYTENTQKTDTLKDSCQKRILNACTFTGKYGLHIAGQYLRATISTTKTAIQQITVLKTLHASLQKIIWMSTSKTDSNGQGARKTKKFWRELDLSQSSGTNQKRAVNGTSNTAKKQSALSKRHAHGVQQNMKNRIWQKIRKDAVQASVLQQNEEPAVSMTKSGCAYGAKKHLLPTNIKNGNTAHIHVHQVITNIKKEMVFNITVEDEHEYFAEDILVSNCDAALYAFRYCYQYRYEKRPKKLTAEEHLEMQIEKEFEDEQNSDYWER